MNVLTFTLKKPLQFSLNCQLLNPSHLADKSPSDIASMLLNYGNSQCRVDEIFDVSGNDAQNIKNFVHTALAITIVE